MLFYLDTAINSCPLKWFYRWLLSTRFIDRCGAQTQSLFVLYTAWLACRRCRCTNPKAPRNAFFMLLDLALSWIKEGKIRLGLHLALSVVHSCISLHPMNAFMLLLCKDMSLLKSITTNSKRHLKHTVYLLEFFVMYKQSNISCKDECPYTTSQSQLSNNATSLKEKR